MPSELLFMNTYFKNADHLEHAADVPVPSESHARAKRSSQPVEDVIDAVREEMPVAFDSAEEAFHELNTHFSRFLRDLNQVFHSDKAFAAAFESVTHQNRLIPRVVENWLEGKTVRLAVYNDDGVTLRVEHGWRVLMVSTPELKAGNLDLDLSKNGEYRVAHLRHILPYNIPPLEE